MRVTRHKVFETNSSSSHSLSIKKGDLVDKNIATDGTIKATGGDFSWGLEFHKDAYTKFQYLITYLFEHVKSQKDINNIVRSSKDFYLLSEVIKEYTDAIIEVPYYKKDLWQFGYIDHQSSDVASEVFESKESLENFLFNPFSVLQIDNDNH